MGEQIITIFRVTGHLQISAHSIQQDRRKIGSLHYLLNYLVTISWRKYTRYLHTPRFCGRIAHT